MVIVVVVFCIFLIYRISMGRMKNRGEGTREGRPRECYKQIYNRAQKRGITMGIIISFWVCVGIVRGRDILLTYKRQPTMV